MYDRLCLGLSDSDIKERINSGMPYTIRMLVPEGVTTFKDMIHGKVVFNNNLIDDQVLMKSDGFPTYHFANIVDDYTLNILFKISTNSIYVSYHHFLKIDLFTLIISS